MKVLNLRCLHHHSFEGWFASEADFQSQSSLLQIECPLCGDTDITRLPTAPHLNMSRAKDPAAPLSSEASHEADSERKGAPTAAAALPPSFPLSAEAQTLQSMWLKAVQHVLERTDDVGERFAEEARRMHYGETEIRSIRGQASFEDTEALRDEGIEVLSLSVPVGSKKTLQ